jgi:prepilin-type N-terminal cleavage/methylation domain-containing protein
MSRWAGSRAAPAKACAACGFTLFELIVVVIIAAVVAVAALQRFLAYQELAERAAMEATLRVVKTGLQIRLAELIIRNRQADAGVLERDNPMQWLAEKPANYRGDYRKPPRRGAWYFDRERGELVYVVITGEWLDVAPSDGIEEIRFRARLLKDVVNFGGTTTQSVTGITLVPVKPYR